MALLPLLVGAAAACNAVLGNEESGGPLGVQPSDAGDASQERESGGNDEAGGADTSGGGGSFHDSGTGGEAGSRDQANPVTNGDFSVNGEWMYSENGDHWSGAYDGTEYQSAPKSYKISHPPNTTNSAGNWAAVEQTVVVPTATTYVLDFWVKDNYAGSITGSVAKQVHIDGVLVWEYDVSGDDGWDHVVNQVTSSLRGKSSATIRLRVYANSSELTYPGISVWWDDIAIIPQ